MPEAEPAVLAPATVTLAESVRNTEPLFALAVTLGEFNATRLLQVPTPVVPVALSVTAEVAEPLAIRVPEDHRILPPVPPFAVKEMVPPAAVAVTLSFKPNDPLPDSVTLYELDAVL